MSRRVIKYGAGLGGIGFTWAYLQRRRNFQEDFRSSWTLSWPSRLYERLALPVVLQTDPETAHRLTLLAARALQSAVLLTEPRWTGSTPIDWLLRPASSSMPPDDGPTMRQQLLGLNFDSPVGISAGFDKNAELVPLFRLGTAPGLGFAEVGSVSALKSDGNPKPRCFRLPKDQAVINRLGLGNEGAEAVAARLCSFECLRGKGNPVGINIAKTHSPSILGDAALDDFAFSYQTLEPYADFVVVNVSCPNTAEGKTFEDPPALKALLERLKAVRGAAQPPMLLKVSPPPDTDEGRASLRSIVEVAQASGVVSGYVVSNTAGDRNVPLSQEGRAAAEAAGRGGLSGAPLRARSTAACREVSRLTEGKVPIIGVGGIDSAEAAYERVRAGASLVEVYSGMVYKGPNVVADIQRGLRRLLARDGFTSIADAVGADVK